MSDITRDNHYVPQWYQFGFLYNKSAKLCYLNLSPEKKLLEDGRIVTLNSRHKYYPSQCFYQTDLYSTFFGKHINDEIERRLFGEIDAKGSRAIRAFIGSDISEWHRNFESLFIYLDAQKIRTLKGLDWLKSHYPELNQNTLMREMQGIRTMYCTLWSEGVREIVSAKNSVVKFIVSDHPVTIYNPRCPPDSDLCNYPNDPSIALMASQTIFPLDRDHCLILTNLEYAEKPDTCDPLSQRTFARNFRTSMVRTDKFILKREFDENEVRIINHILKARARKFVAAEEEEWLYPENNVQTEWKEIAITLLPPKNELWGFGGELYVGFKNGSVRYQDAYGRTTPIHNFFKKKVLEADLKRNDFCGCGSGKKYKKCCENKHEKLRPSWAERSIRERNISFYNGLIKILGLDNGNNWNDIRRNLNEKQVREIHELYGFLWPIETDLCSLLPKPDKKARALYTGLLDSRTTPLIISNATLYFEEILVQHPFLHPASLNKKYSPTENPYQYKYQTLKNVMLFSYLMPFVEAGFVNLFPDPCSLDSHLKKQMLDMSAERGQGIKISPKDKKLFDRLQREDFEELLAMLPRELQKNMIIKTDPDATEDSIALLLKHIDRIKQNNPLVLLQDDILQSENGGQLNMIQMCPNFEMALFLAQITGSFLVTDSHHRWREIMNAQHPESDVSISRFGLLSTKVGNEIHDFIQEPDRCLEARKNGLLGSYRKFIQTLFASFETGNDIENEDALILGFSRAHSASRKQITVSGHAKIEAKLRLYAPKNGIYHNNVHRLLVTNGIEKYLNSVPMAMLIDFD